MKKIFAFAALAAAVLFAGNTANAQLGINVGYAPQSYKMDYTSGSLSLKDTTSMTGFFLGVNYNVNITGDLNVSVGLQGRYNTYSDENTVLGVTTKTNSTQMLVDVPILFNYGLSLTDDLKVSLFLGPTISYALSGKTTNTVGSLETTTDWYKEDEGNQGAFDLGGTLGVCASFSGIRLFGGYNMGLMNLSKADNTTVKGSNWFIGLGYAL
ncbi:MAG: PorT family protein [Bacteroidales bacterium]|nr:PorT family protein [Bacteroidales bacterium]